MTYQQVKKSAKHSLLQRKQSQIAPRAIDDNHVQTNSPPPLATTFSLPSRAERDAIRKSLFGIQGEQIQTKLTIGEAGDKYEQEADRVAAQVVNQINAPMSSQPEQSQSIQREAIPSEEELQMKAITQLQRSEAGMTATPDLETSIQQARGSGQPLADNIRKPMERVFGADFSGVKVHTDAQSHQLNQSIQAKAFTTGQDVFFRQGEYNPGSRGGQELIAHELTHVVQQNGGAVQRSPLSAEKQREVIQQHREAIAVGEASTDLETPINRARGSVQPIDAGLQRSMGHAMPADLGGVRVHTDAQSDQLSHTLQAKAFTTGQDVFFRQGEYNPASRAGQALSAHELTHVVQPGGKAILQKRDYNPNPVPTSNIPLTAHHVIPHSNLEQYKEKAEAKQFIPNKDQVTLEQLVNIHLISKLGDRKWGADYSKYGAMRASEFLSDTKIKKTDLDYKTVQAAINKLEEAKTKKKRHTDITKDEKAEITGSFFMWSPANIFIGPSPQLRDWDPGSDGLDTDAQYFLDQDQYRLLNQTYEWMQQQGHEDEIKKNFRTLATKYNHVTPYDARRWRHLDPPSEKYSPLDRDPIYS